MSQTRVVQRKRVPDFIKRWLFFVAGVALFPVIASAIIGPLADKELSYGTLLGSGELLVAALAIAADASGRLLVKRPEGRDLNIFLGCLGVGALCLVLVSCSVTKVVRTETTLLANISIAVFVISFGVSLVGVSAAEAQETEVRNNAK